MGTRKVEMLKHTQHLAFALVLVFIGAKIAAPSLPVEILMAGLAGVGVNFGAFVAGNVKGDHGGTEAKDALAQPPKP
jgi:hypothetical protein